MLTMKKGSKLFVRANFHFVGEVEKITASWIYFKNASWVDWTGGSDDDSRFGATLAKGFSKKAAYEFMGDVAVLKCGIHDIAQWKHELPLTSQ